MTGDSRMFKVFDSYRFGYFKADEVNFHAGVSDMYCPSPAFTGIHAEFTGGRNGSPLERLLCRNDVQQFALDVDDFPDFLAVSELLNGFVSKSLGLDVIF